MLGADSDIDPETDSDADPYSGWVPRFAGQAKSFKPRSITVDSTKCRQVQGAVAGFHGSDARPKSGQGSRPKAHYEPS